MRKRLREDAERGVLVLAGGVVARLHRGAKLSVPLLDAREVGADLRELVLETRDANHVAVTAGFGGVISEVGASMMVGGNIKG